MQIKQHKSQEKKREKYTNLLHFIFSFLTGYGVEETRKIFHTQLKVLSDHMVLTMPCHDISMATKGCH